MHTLTDLPAGAAALSDAETFAAAPQPRTLALGFSGDGREYFRIWVVNLLLTLATLGIYSAWAKVRRLQYFDRNTTLAGASFDFHGNPKAVLAGRALALVLLVAYHYAFGFSNAFGLVVVGALLVLMPYLMRGALRFRLGNTMHRGLSLGFDAPVGAAYLAWLPPIVAVVLPGVLLALYPEQPAWVALSLLPYLAWPLMHAQIRRYQHAHLLFGDRHSSYAVRAISFYKPYLAALLLAVAGLACGAGVAVLRTGLPGGGSGIAWGPLIGAAIWLYAIYLIAGPYMVVRVSNLAWSSTRFPGVRIRSSLPARGFLRLQAKNALFTLLTLGLYRPFAAVSVARFRLAHIHIEMDGDIDAFAARIVQQRGDVAGDGAADGFGIDLSW